VTGLHTDKVDLLFMIDNSASMGDKQALLALAVPDLVSRLVSPNCLDATGHPTGQTAQPDGSCPSGTTAEFPPVHDMHIGVVTSSLGGRGGDECPTTGSQSTNPTNPALSAHDDDRGELINRGGTPSDPTVESTVADATSPDDFLSWFPPVTPNTGKPAPPTTAVTTAMQLVGDFTQILGGVHEHGCGFEAQNEAWYRFLIQPDPFDSISKPDGVHAQLDGFDETILKQRADFLRPDSLVAVIVVTDENEEVADPLSIGGEGWIYENSTFPGGPGPAPEGTIECKQPVDPNNPTVTGPYGPNCTSCGFDAVKKDPNFATRCPNDGASGTGGYLDPMDDQINVRFFHQKERLGVFSGYPVTRYIRGLTSLTVPDVPHEHDSTGNYIGDTDSQANCVNPLFAQNLPTSSSQETCALTRGPRTADHVFYVAIAGVPHQLLQAAPGDVDCPAGTNAGDCPQKGRLTTADWTLITGADPEHYDFSGADFHMIESEEPRTTNTGNWATVSSCGPNLPASCDPISGREWNPKNGDLQHSCIFDLRPMYGGVGKDCTNAKYAGACDCAAGDPLADSTLCDSTTPTLQIYGKAYPSVREMVIAHAMAQVNAVAGGQSVVSSLCPIHVTEQSPGDPLFGYRPAVGSIVGHFSGVLSQ
jgi:hypothetical protein